MTTHLQHHIHICHTYSSWPKR